MKKRKLLRNISLVALSAVMMSGVALAATACGGGNKADTITVSIFCNKSDEHTNNTIIKKWKEAWNKTNGTNIDVKLQVNDNKDDYFQTMQRALADGTAGIADIIYLSPKYVQSYADDGIVLDLAKYLDDDALASMQGVWSNSISYYGYSTTVNNYVPGQEIVYKPAEGGNPAGYYTKNGNSKVGIYGLPKDYSNFSMGYNKVYFTDAMKKAYTTTKGSTARKVANASKIAGTSGYVTEYTGYKTTEKNNYVATYAVDATDGSFKKGEEAPLISVGVPVNYKPFNFYRYNDYASALAAGDPMACAVEAYTFGDGYTVTIPGFPGETFKITENDTAALAADVPYDATLGHTVFTYAEYGALVWAVTYYLNTFDWDSDTPTSGLGGLTIKLTATRTAQQVIYGSEQYEGAQGNALYLLPWLASNDADLIDDTSAYCASESVRNAASSDAYLSGLNQTTNSSTLASTTTTNTRSKLNLDGTTRNATVQYGVDSYSFMETYAAFEEFGSTWNGNSGNAGDEATTKSNVSGWDYFCMGAAVFYGAGTWDAATRNDTVMDVFEFGQMPSPIAEKYALYSNVKDADYNMKVYSNDPALKGTGDEANNDGAQRATKSQGLKQYTAEEIRLNQIKRQDKWAARMDSVGYAANGRFANMVEGDEEYWKAAATASLIQALTLGETEQITLTYAGAQLPNYSSQCSDFLYYQDSKYANGAFKDMITPEGISTTTEAEIANGTARKIWDYYYTVAQAMAADSLKGATNKVTVQEWITQSGYGDYKEGAAKGEGTLKYDPQYANVKLSEFTGTSGTNISFAMKVLRMVCFTYAERDMNIRMQYGLNSVRDSSMYTVGSSWIGNITAIGKANMMAYINQETLSAAAIKGLGNDYSKGGVLARCVGSYDDATYSTPATFCLEIAWQTQRYLKLGT